MAKDPYQIKKLLNTKNGNFTYYSLPELEKQGHDISKLPFSIRILLENALRNFDDFAITKENIETLLNWQPTGSDKDIPFKPARVLMQDFTEYRPWSTLLLFVLKLPEREKIRMKLIR
jgi:aconitate hydratase